MERIDQILEVVLKYTQKDFSTSIPISPKGDEIDAISLGINTMAEELGYKLIEVEENNKKIEAKNRELKQFVYIASHDLQEPLRTVVNFVELFEEEYKGNIDENAKVYLHFIKDAANRMSDLVKDLLDYSLIGKTKEKSLIDCQIMVKEILTDLDSIISESEATITCLDLPKLYGYEMEIRSLFQNLISNAIKFKRKGIKPIIEIGAKDDDSHWHFYIKDNGLGIPENQIDRIFLIFQRLHSRSVYEGNGIGLSHVLKIVELHAGKIWVKSKEGEGSTFHFTLKKN